MIHESIVRDWDWMVEKLGACTEVLTHHGPFDDPKFVVSQPAISWHVNRSFDELMASEIPQKEDYFPQRSFIRIDIDSPKHALESVKTILKQDNWESRIWAVKKARELVLKRYQIFPHLAHLIRDQPPESLSPKPVLLPVYRRSKTASLNHVIYKIKKRFGFTGDKSDG